MSYRIQQLHDELGRPDGHMVIPEPPASNDDPNKWKHPLQVLGEAVLKEGES